MTLDFLIIALVVVATPGTGMIYTVAAGLTRIANRRASDQALDTMLRRLLPAGQPMLLLLADADYFKALNMRYGQSFGDEVLVVFSGILRSLMRSEDIVSRIGGDSIGVLLPGATSAQTEAVCQRVIMTLTEIRQAAGDNGIPITASVGISRIGKSMDGTLKKAELALFLAKAKGHSRLEIANGRGFPIG